MTDPTSKDNLPEDARIYIDLAKPDAEATIQVMVRNELLSIHMAELNKKAKKNAEVVLENVAIQGTSITKAWFNDLGEINQASIHPNQFYEQTKRERKRKGGSPAERLLERQRKQALAVQNVKRSLKKS